MNWYDVDDILYDGDEAAIRNVRCPDCGGEIEFCFSEGTKTFRTMCRSCGVLNVSHGSSVPNCYVLVGNVGNCGVKTDE